MSTAVQKREITEVIDETDISITSKRAKLDQTSENQSSVILQDIQLIQDKTHVNKVGPDGLSQCFHRVRAAMYVSVAPCFVNDPLSAIKQQHLDPMLMSYCSALRGVIISYFRLKIMDQSQMEDELSGSKIALGRVGNDTPFSFLWCTVDFLLWSPKIGDTVEGWCYMQSQSHIGLLIHDAFNATIKKFNIPAEWQFVPNEEDDYHDADVIEGDDIAASEPKEAEDAATEGTEATPKTASGPSDKDERRGGRFGRSLGHWIDENEIPVQGKLRFRIRAMHLAGRAISIEGTLVSPQDERDTQPVTLKESKSSSGKKHMRFDDQPAAISKEANSDKTEKSVAEESSDESSDSDDDSSDSSDGDDKKDEDDDEADKNEEQSTESSEESSSSSNEGSSD